MQKAHIIQLFIAVVSCMTSHACLAQPYSISSKEDTYATLQNAIQINQTIWEDEPLITSIGFDFEIMGRNFNKMRIQNGQIHFDDYIFLSPLGGTDLEGKGKKATESPIQYQLEGEIGQRIFKLEFKNAGFYSGTRSDFIHFQVWLYESSNQIEFRYGLHQIEETAMIYEAIQGPSIGIGIWASNRQTFSFNGLKGAIKEPTGSDGKNVYRTTYQCPFLNGTPAPNTVYKFKANTPKSLMVNEKLNITFFKTYPNPFSSILNIEFKLAKIDDFKLELLDVKGQLIQQIAAQDNALPNLYSFQMNGSNLIGGVYVCRLTTGNKILSKKIFLSK